MNKSREYADPIAWLLRRASDYICSFDTIARGDLLILYARVTTYPQWLDGNHLHQLAELQTAIADVGAVECDHLAHWGPGYDNHAMLTQAAALARQHGAKILATEVSRLCRPPGIRNTSPPRVRDLDSLRLCTAGVTLVTLLHPDAPPDEVHKHRSRSGQVVSRGGRPRNSSRPKSYRPTLTYPELLRLRQMVAAEMSLRQMASELGRSHSTIQGWLAKFVHPEPIEPEQ